LRSVIHQGRGVGYPKVGEDETKTGVPRKKIDVQGSSMTSFVASLLPFLRQEEFVRIEVATGSVLTLRCGRARIVFDRLSRVVTRNGRLVSAFGPIQEVRVTREQIEERPPVWSVNLRLSGSRAVQIGHLPDGASASTVAANIGSITGARVIG
jgi:hypothetical protein